MFSAKTLLIAMSNDRYLIQKVVTLNSLLDRMNICVVFCEKVMKDLFQNEDGKIISPGSFVRIAQVFSIRDSQFPISNLCLLKVLS